MPGHTAITPPVLKREMDGLVLEYDGWSDQVTSRVRAEHSNRKEMRWYRLACRWKNGTRELTHFEIDAEHLHPDHHTKGTAHSNRQDIKTDFLRKAELWRRQKIVEQDRLQKAMNSDAALKLDLVPDTYPRIRCEAWWVSGAVLLEPKKCGRSNCRDGWIEVLPVGSVDAAIARYIAQLFCEIGPYEEAIEAARTGLTLREIQERIAAAEGND